MRMLNVLQHFFSKRWVVYVAIALILVDVFSMVLLYGWVINPIEYTGGDITQFSINTQRTITLALTHLFWSVSGDAPSKLNIIHVMSELKITPQIICNAADYYSNPVFAQEFNYLIDTVNGTCY